MRAIVWLIKYFVAKNFLVFEMASEETKKRRLSICNRCEFKKEKEGYAMCGVCGCFLEIKAGSLINFNHRKRAIEITHCPMGLWDDKWIVGEYTN